MYLIHQSHQYSRCDAIRDGVLLLYTSLPFDRRALFVVCFTPFDCEETKKACSVALVLGTLVGLISKI